MQTICVVILINRTCLSWMHCPRHFSISTSPPTRNTCKVEMTLFLIRKHGPLLTYRMFRWSGDDCHVIVASVHVRRDLISSTTVWFGKIGIDRNLSFAVAITLNVTAKKRSVSVFCRPFLGYKLHEMLTILHDVVLIRWENFQQKSIIMCGAIETQHHRSIDFGAWNQFSLIKYFCVDHIAAWNDQKLDRCSSLSTLKSKN